MSVKYSRRTNLSNEFTEQATKEINEEIEHNSQIIKSCKNDEDITNKCSEIEKHLHKIKGLAPMMGQKQIGELAWLNDKLIKKIIEGKKIQGIFETINQSNKLMKDLMQNSTLEIDDPIQIIKTKYAAYLDKESV
jgi:chemotaxis protein histidine kinase CheA